MNVPIVTSENYWQMLDRCDFLIDILNANFGVADLPKELIDELNMIAEAIEKYETSVYMPVSK